jgi:hypothetical protein
MGSESSGSESSGSISESSAYSAAYIQKYIKDKKIFFCCLGISNLSKESYTQKIANVVAGKYYTHTSLWLSDQKPYEDEDNAYGLVLEYGKYDEEYEIKIIVDDYGKEKKMEVKKSCVIYHYGKKGGLRYYAKRFQDYIDIFGTVAYVELDVENDNQIMFLDFINKVAPVNEEEWIKDKYHFIEKNCHDFTSKAIQILKPSYRAKDIKVNDKTKLSGSKRESILPGGILTALKSNK